MVGHQADLGLLDRFQGVSDTSEASGQALATGIHIYSGRNGLIRKAEVRFRLVLGTHPTSQRLRGVASARLLRNAAPLHSTS